MAPQDWIDYKLGRLPQEKCKEYMLLSPEEQKAYEERYGTCAEVFKAIHPDGSANTMCQQGAFGEKDGKPSKLNICDECYLCEKYHKREGNDITVIDMEVIDPLQSQ